MMQGRNILVQSVEGRYLMENHYQSDSFLLLWVSRSPCFTSERRIAVERRSSTSSSSFYYLSFLATQGHSDSPLLLTRLPLGVFLLREFSLLCCSIWTRRETRKKRRFFTHGSQQQTRYRQRSALWLLHVSDCWETHKRLVDWLILNSSHSTPERRTESHTTDCLFFPIHFPSSDSPRKKRKEKRRRARACYLLRVQRLRGRTYLSIFSLRWESRCIHCLSMYVTIILFLGGKRRRTIDNDSRVVYQHLLLYSLLLLLGHHPSLVSLSLRVCCLLLIGNAVVSFHHASRREL